jgi:hypothetical protein
MKAKTIGASVLIAVGAIVLLTAIYAKSRVSEAKQNISKGSGMFHDNPVNKQIGSALEKKISSYDAPIMLAMVGGGILVVVGIGTLFFGNKKRW